MKLLVTACNGQLGVDVTEHFRKTCEVAAYKDVDLDITDREKMLATVEREKPDVVINTAAITNVDGCEKNQELAYHVNAEGAGVVTDAARACGAALVHISTDYVFDGTSRKAYVETDTPCPASVYGKTKYEGEKLVLAYDKSVVLRTAWLFGPHGNNFVKTMLRLAEEKGEVGVVVDQVGNPTSTFELVRIIDAVLRSGKTGIFHATCEGACSWNAFARAIFEEAGMNVLVHDLTTEQFPRPAKRPPYSDLSKEKLLRECGYRATPWRAALKEYFDYVRAETAK